jgi:20S proteasome alpha/beta subunit
MSQVDLLLNVWSEEPLMTCCIAALCDNGRAIVYASDRAVSNGIIESEPKTSKILTLHPSWRLMYSGAETSPVFDIADEICASLPRDKSFTIREIDQIVEHSYSQVIPSSSYNQYRISLLVFGFDTSSGRGYISSVDPVNPIKAMRRDSPGYWAIGTGRIGAFYMMDFRQVSYKESLARMVYAIFERKYSGELATGVGKEKTDLFIWRGGEKPIAVKRESKRRLEKLAYRLQPKAFKNKHRLIVATLPEVRQAVAARHASNTVVRIPPCLSLQESE